MYEVFGEFDSAEEMNRAAAGLLEEGDTKNILILAKENGIEEGIAQAYNAGAMEELTDPFMAAVGKLTVEKEQVTNMGSMKEVYFSYLVSQCMEEGFARKVRNKGKSFDDCLKKTYEKIEEECSKWMKENNIPRQGMVGCPIPDEVTYQWAKEYYVR
ncbi:Cas9 inhibitor AcrIIA9 family protein [Anaerosacchariphilus polymeriproducens]|uniref:Uncharacterized protein n=1 Tax=Anaerosacchariphilus polymeriproducens TaxID=1812858 RepID=A0A371ARJ2_9FIRM|nr:Cas9 inhibitor AcrIIA9 family protein [Anaerosacchariphilus polymeriproducens]RDU22187.1 hypothetical protein DWV06_16810 [Anaerosacchariphilus polymeriproducens]